MFGKLENVRIQGMATCVPNNIIDNMVYKEQLGEGALKKQIRNTGIQRRHKLAKGQKASELVIAAAKKIMSHLAWLKDEISVLVYVTQSPDYEKPSTAFVIQKELGLSQDALVFDVNLGCSGFVAGVQIVSSLLQKNGEKGLLLISTGEYGEQRGSIEDEMLFGDAGCAVAIEKVENSQLKYCQKSDGKHFDAIYKEKNGPTIMDGLTVYGFVINEVADGIHGTMEQFELSTDEIDYYVFHQGQKMILKGLMDICDIEYEKVLFSYSEYGNTAGVSIPLTLCANFEKLQEMKKDTVRLYMCGFGVGLAWGSIYTEMDWKGILPIVTL